MMNTGGLYSSGSAYLFQISTGQILQRFAPSDPSAYAYFGDAVSISGNYAVVGAPTQNIGSEGNAGAVYVFDLTTGAELYKMTGLDSVQSDGFGTTIATNNDVILVGSPGDDDNGSNSGSVYIIDIHTGVQSFTRSSHRMVVAWNVLATQYP